MINIASGKISKIRHTIYTIVEYFFVYRHILDLGRKSRLQFYIMMANQCCSMTHVHMNMYRMQRTIFRIIIQIPSTLLVCNMLDPIGRISIRFAYILSLFMYKYICTYIVLFAMALQYICSNIYMQIPRSFLILNT